jgi:hypothetical protein
VPWEATREVSSLSGFALALCFHARLQISYGGVPVQPSAVKATSAILFAYARPSSPPPTVVPTTRGGIQIEWHTPSVELETSVAPPSCISALFENRATGEEWERDFRSDLSELAKAIGQLPDAR